MGRADDLRDRHTAELAMITAEDDLLQAKNADDPERLREVKVRLREARQRFRELREAAPTELGEGDAVVQPATTKASARVRQPGGGS